MDNGKDRLYLFCGSVFMTLVSLVGLNVCVQVQPGVNTAIATMCACTLGIFSTVLVSSSGSRGFYVAGRLCLWLSLLAAVAACAIGINGIIR